MTIEAEATRPETRPAGLGSLHQMIAAGRAARRSGDPSGALHAFEVAMRADRRGELGFIAYGDELRRQGRAADAGQIAQQVLQRHPHSLDALMLAARCARDLGDGARAITIYRAAADLAAADPAPATELAHELRKAGRFAEAVAQYERARMLAPDRVFPVLGLARCARAAGDVAASLAFNQAAVTLAPADPLIRVEVANDLRDLGRTQEADAAYMAVLALQPAHYAALMGRAVMLRRAGDVVGALNSLAGAAAAQPQALPPVLNAIVIHRDLGDLAASLALAEALVASGTHLAAAWTQIGWIERSRGNAAEALAAFTRAHDAEPGNVDVLVQMAVEQHGRGDQQRCESLFAQAIAIDPTHGGALIQSALHAMAMNENDTALDLFLRALRAGSLRLQACLGACEALARLGRVDEALALLDATEQQTGGDPSLTARRITLLRETGDLPNALIAAHAAAPASSRHSGLLVAVLRVLLLAGTDDQLDTCLAAASPVTERDRILLDTMNGFVAEERGDLAAAKHHYRHAVAQREQDSAPYLDLARINLLELDPDAAFAAMQRNRALTAAELRMQGHSANVSQTHFGQMIDEYRLDPSSLRAVASLRTRPPADQIAPILALASDQPDSTLLAVAAVDALWRDHHFDKPPPRTASGHASRIPRRIFQFWDSPDAPDDVAKLMQSWPAHNLDHEYRRLHDKQAQLFLWKGFGADAVHAYRRARQPAHKADLLRLALLKKHGGIYADADDRCIAPLSTLIDADDELVLHREDLGTLGNNFIAVVPDHPVINRAFDAAVVATNRGDNDLLWFSTGPGLITRAVIAWIAAGGPDPADTLTHVRILSRRALHAGVVAHCRTAYKKTVRHWENSAFARAERRDQPPAPE